MVRIHPRINNITAQVTDCEFCEYWSANVKGRNGSTICYHPNWDEISDRWYLDECEYIVDYRLNIDNGLVYYAYLGRYRYR